MIKIDKPWGYEIIWAQTENYAGKILYINAGHRLSKQFHQTKEETIYVTKGLLLNYEADGTITEVRPGEALHINVGQIHRFGAKDSDVEIIEVSTPHLDDVVRLEDDYNR